MTSISRSLIPALAVSLVLCAAPARSAPAPGERHAPRDAPLRDVARDAPHGSRKVVAAARPLGLSFELGLATAYVFRGSNVFQADSQLDPTLLIQPEVDWVIGRTGFTVGWWSVYQLTGDNADANEEAGLGAEQGLYVHYERALTGALTLAAWLNWYFFPVATEEAAGVDFPCYLEPGAGLHLQTAIGLGLDLSYLAGLQSGISQYSYLYLNPYADHTFELADTLWLELKLGLGYKLFAEDPSTVTNNMFDVQLKATLTWSLTRHLYAKALVGLAWTNLEQREETDDKGQPTTVDPGFSDEVAAFGGLNVGVEL